MARMDNLMGMLPMGMMVVLLGQTRLMMDVTYKMNENLCLRLILPHFQMAFRLPKIFLRVLLEDKLTTTYDRTC